MQYLNLFLDVIKNHYFDFDGRVGRKSFWIFVIINAIISYILGLIPFKISGFPVLPIVYSLLMLLPILGLCARRLHDIGKSGWFLLVNFIPLIGSIWFLILMCKKGDEGGNQFGGQEPNS